MVRLRHPRRGQFAPALAAQLGLLAAAAPVCAGELETSRLSYAVPSHHVACPDETSFRNLVAARLGYDPFAPAGKHDTSVELTQEGDRLRGRARVTRQGSSTPGVRELVVGIKECEGLAAALATAVAIALDPVRPPVPASAGPSEPPPALPTPPPPPAPAPFPPRASSPPPPASLLDPIPPPSPVLLQSPQSARPVPSSPGRAGKSARVSLFAGAGGVLSAGALPSLALGSEVGVGLRVSWFSLEALGRFETMPGVVRADSGDRLEATIVSGGLMPCANHFSGWFGCAQARFGALQARAPDVLAPNLGSSLTGALGLRGGYALTLASVLTFRAAVEGGVQAVRTSLLVDRRPVWTVPPAFGGLELSVLVTFL